MLRTSDAHLSLNPYNLVLGGVIITPILRIKRENSEDLGNLLKAAWLVAD